MGQQVNRSSEVKSLSESDWTWLGEKIKGESSNFFLYLKNTTL
jgi:hypothetical protein